MHMIGFYPIPIELRLILGNAIPIPEVSKSIQRLIDSIINTIPISFSKAERGFSQINVTMTSQCNKRIKMCQHYYSFR